MLLSCTIKRQCQWNTSNEEDDLQLLPAWQQCLFKTRDAARERDVALLQAVLSLGTSASLQCTVVGDGCVATKERTNKINTMHAVRANPSHFQTGFYHYPNPISALLARVGCHICYFSKCKYPNKSVCIFQATLPGSAGLR